MRYAPGRIAAFPMITAAILGAVALEGCDRSTTTTAPEPGMSAGHSPAMHAGVVTGETQRDIARLRERTARFNQFDAAVDAGWSAPIPGCFEDPQLGGMGFHYGNPALIDGTVDLLQPELLVYAPEKNGRLRFVAVEYIVPFAAWTAAEPPQLYGQFFHRNEAFGIWVLHVWHMRENPQGIFADWNPKVSCRYAP